MKASETFERYDGKVRECWNYAVRSSKSFMENADTNKRQADGKAELVLRDQLTKDLKEFCDEVDEVSFYAKQKAYITSNLLTFIFLVATAVFAILFSLVNPYFILAALVTALLSLLAALGVFGGTSKSVEDINVFARRKASGEPAARIIFEANLDAPFKRNISRGTAALLKILTLLGVVLALVIGVVFGCALPPLCAHSPGFHKGYDLYNAGPAAGFLCFLIFAVLYKTLGVEAPAITADLGEGNWTFVNVFCIVTFALCVVFGIVLNGGLKDYGKLFTDSGYKSDFTAKYSVGSNVMNIGIYGLFIVLYYNLVGAKFTGPTMGAIFCMLCCCCNGATPLNVFPIMIGYVIMGLLNRAGVTAFAVNAQAIVVGLCFASGLAPISGEYGILAGIVGGILHYCLVTSVPAIHGGFNLYNGGFTAGIVCFLYVPILEHYFKSKKQRREAKA